MGFIHPPPQMRRRESIRTEKSCKIWRSLSAERNLERGNKRIENIHEMEAAKEEDEHGQPNNMVDRVGTLLLCPVQVANPCHFITITSFSAERSPISL